MPGAQHLFEMPSVNLEVEAVISISAPQHRPAAQPHLKALMSLLIKNGVQLDQWRADWAVE